MKTKIEKQVETLLEENKALRNQLGDVRNARYQAEHYLKAAQAQIATLQGQLARAKREVVDVRDVAETAAAGCITVGIALKNELSDQRAWRTLSAVAHYAVERLKVAALLGGAAKMAADESEEV